MLHRKVFVTIEVTNVTSQYYVINFNDPWKC